MGYAALWVSLFFKHTRGLWYAGDLCLLLFLLTQRKALSSLFRLKDKDLRFLAAVWGLFLFFLLGAVFYSPYPSASLDAFLLNYFFNFVLFLGLVILCLRGETPEEYQFLWIVPLLINMGANLYYLIFSIGRCHYDFFCLLMAGMNLMKDSLFQGLVVTSPVYVFGFFFFGVLFFKIRSRARYFLAGLSLMDLGFLLWFGRRAALLGIFCGLMVLFLCFPHRGVRLLSFGFWILLLSLLIALWTTPYGRKLLLRSEKISLLLSGDYQAFPRAGSLGERLYIWPIYLKEALRHPLKGMGLGRRVQKRVWFREKKEIAPQEHAHNLFLNLWLQAGLPAMLCFMYLYGWIFRKAYVLGRFEGSLMGLSMTGFLTAFLVMSLFEGLEEQARFVPFWMGAGLTFGYYLRSRIFNELPGDYD